jgi:protocatechuate 3,4-dioxygenase beta subunit
MTLLLLALLAAQAPANMGAIRGRVTDKETGRPIAHALVRLTSSDRPGSASAATDDRGAFEFTAVTPGRYFALVTAPRHVMDSLSAAQNNSELVVRRGEVLETAAALAPAYAVTVRVVDPFGDPLSEIPVEVRSLQSGNFAAAMYQRTTDDLGRLRIPGLPPGRYLVCAQSMGTFGTSSPDAPVRRERLLRTCYPSALEESDAEPVTVTHSDVADLQIRMRRGRTFTVAGTIVDAAGAPATGARASLWRFQPGGSSGTLISDSSGAFHLANVHPGQYAIEAVRGGTDMPEMPGPEEKGFLPIRIDTDLDGLVVAMRRTVNVAGRVALDDPSAPFPSRRNYAPPLIRARLADDRLPGDASGRSATMRTDQTFTLDAMFGPRLVDVLNVPPGWFVKTIRYGGKDVLDRPVEFKDGRGTLDIVLSNRGATLDGTVADVVDQRVPRAKVLLFRAPAVERGTPRLVASAVSASGNFQFGPLHDGDYLIVAVAADTPTPRPDDADTMARLAALGERMTIGDLDQRTIQLRVTTVR